MLQYDSLNTQNNSHLYHQQQIYRLIKIYKLHLDNLQMINKFSNFLVRQLHFSFAQANSRGPFLKISSTALQRLKNIMQERKSQNLVGLKISLTKKGCSGLAYSMDYIREQQIKKYDEVIEQQGIKVVVDSKAIMALVGTQMSYVEDELGSQFVFNNPNEKGRCGCGTSFHL